VTKDDFFLSRHLGESEGVTPSESLLVDSLEPPLVANLDEENVEVSVLNTGGDELVAASLIAISSTGEKIILVVLGSLLVGLLRNIKQRNSGNRSRLETTLGFGLSLPSLLSEEEVAGLQELLRGTELLNGVLAPSGFLDDGAEVDGIEVVLVALNDIVVVTLRRVDPLGREEERVFVPLGRDETLGVSGLSENVGWVSVVSLGLVELSSNTGGSESTKTSHHVTLR